MSNATTTDRFWMHGGSAQLHGQLYRGLGVVAEVSGAHTGGINSSGVGLDDVTATFGPRYTWSPPTAGTRSSARLWLEKPTASSSVFPTVRGATDSSNSLVWGRRWNEFVAVAAYGSASAKQAGCGPSSPTAQPNSQLSAPRRRSCPPVPIKTLSSRKFEDRPLGPTLLPNESFRRSFQRAFSRWLCGVAHGLRKDGLVAGIERGSHKQDGGDAAYDLDEVRGFL